MQAYVIVSATYEKMKWNQSEWIFILWFGFLREISQILVKNDAVILLEQPLSWRSKNHN
jgi:hypothetical protein